MRPVPWFWVARLVLGIAATVIWGITHPHAQVWQLVLVCAVTIASLESLRFGYQREQDRIARRKTRGNRP